MNASIKLKLPYISPAQAQKHVTHNEAIKALDVLSQICIVDKDLPESTGSSTEGDCFIVANNALGVWLGKEKQIAVFQDNTWEFYMPNPGWLAYVADEGIFYVYDGADWVVSSQNSLGGVSSTINTSSQNAMSVFGIFEEELMLTGGNVESNISIPDRAIVFGVTTRVTQDIIGPTSFDCGITGESSKYGGSLGISIGSTNSGITGPTAYYADTPIKFSPNAGSFGSGKVRLAIHYMLCSPSLT